MIKIIWAMDRNKKFWSFSGEVFDEIYLQQPQIEGAVYVTSKTFSIALLSKANQEFH